MLPYLGRVAIRCPVEAISSTRLMTETQGMRIVILGGAGFIGTRLGGLLR